METAQSKEITAKIVNDLDALVAKLCPEIPKSMELQVFMDADGVNVRLLSQQGGQDESATIVDAWQTAMLYQAEDECTKCGAPNDNGEGWDGLCGNCADVAESDRIR